MAWLQVKINTQSSIAERLADTLMEVGALSTAIEDTFAGSQQEEPIFEEPGEPVDQLWAHSQISALFTLDCNIAQLIQQAAQASQTTIPTYRVETIEEQDWVQATQSQFNPIRISDRLWITPSWHVIPDPKAINLQLDPGLAFGTGSHPTTRLCLQWLSEQLQGGEKVLDYGCGSGILAIAALKLGAHSTTGIDIDSQAVQTSLENAKRNQVNAQFFLPNEAPAAKYDIVLANILANPLRVLGELLANQVKRGGKIILSGILTDQAVALSAIYNKWFKMDAPVFDEGWARLTGTRR